MFNSKVLFAAVSSSLVLSGCLGSSAGPETTLPEFGAGGVTDASVPVFSEGPATEDVQNPPQTSMPDVVSSPEVSALMETYSFDERSDRVQALQEILGVSADGHYGNQTRNAHIDELNARGMDTGHVPSSPTASTTVAPAATTTTTATIAPAPTTTTTVAPAPTTTTTVAPAPTTSTTVAPVNYEAELMSFLTSGDDAYSADVASCAVDALNRDGYPLAPIAAIVSDPAAYEEFSDQTALYASEVSAVRPFAQLMVATSDCEAPGIQEEHVAKYLSDIDEVSGVYQFPNPESYALCSVTNLADIYQFAGIYANFLFGPVADAPASADAVSFEEYLDSFYADLDEEDSPLTKYFDLAFGPSSALSVDSECGSHADSLRRQVVSSVTVVDDRNIEFTFVGGVASLSASFQGENTVSFGPSAPSFSPGDASGVYEFPNHGFVAGDTMNIYFGSNGYLHTTLVAS